MNTTVYISGSMVILDTPFFICKSLGAKFGIPDGAEIIGPNDTINGKPFLVITDKKAPTIFKKYYASGSVSQRGETAPFMNNSLDDCFINFDKRISEVVNLIHQNDVFYETKQVLYRLSIVSAVAALDTLISDLVLFIGTKDRDCFLKIIGFLNLSATNSFKLMEKLIHMWCDNAIEDAEIQVIKHVLHKSYSSMSEIKKILSGLYGINIRDVDNVEEILNLRHLIAHRNGRTGEGKFVDLSQEKVYLMINRIQNFVDSIKLENLTFKAY